MNIYKVPHGNGYYRIVISSDVEFSNPVEYYSSGFIEYTASMDKDIILSKNLQIPIQDIEDFVVKRAIERWKVTFQEIIGTEIPDNFISILNSESKKDQIKLLKNQSLTPSVLLALIFKACADYAFLFSQYTARHHHNGVDKDQVPKLIELQGDKVIKIGETKLSDGQLKNIVEQRKVVISKFLDKGSTWHCFFTTFRSLNKGETWKDGKPHFHYISDKFGISRETVVKELKKYNYNLGNLPHIELNGYRENE